MEGDLLIIGIPRGIMSSKRMGKLMLRYKIPPKYMCRIPSDDEYISTPDPSEVAMCKEIFRAKFYLPLYPFIERLLVRY